MALSETVQTSLDEATSSLRNALSFAARNERPSTCSSIAKILTEIEHVKGFDDVMDSIERMTDGFS